MLKRPSVPKSNFGGVGGFGGFGDFTLVQFLFKKAFAKPSRSADSLPFHPRKS
jgi:hypothetical protein